MNTNQPTTTKRTIQTPSGRIAYVEQGSGPVALFVHGVLLNGHLWRHQLAHLSDIRRCIALDLLAHGDTEIAADQDVSVTANAGMLEEFLDALSIDRVDLVGNDSGGGIAQIFAALHPERIRSLTLTDCDAHDNWPPEAFKPFLAMAADGGLSGTLNAMLLDKRVYRSAEALGPAYEHPERVTDESIEIYLRPLVSTEQRTRDLQRFLAAFDNRHTVAVEARLKTLKAPTLIVWGTDDVYFDEKWSRWLAETIPGTRRRVELEGARIFFPEERWTEFNRELRAHWEAAAAIAPASGRTRPSQQSRARRFREQNYGGRLLLPNAWDAASARIFEEAGFTAIGTTSAGIAYAQGLRDAERIGRDAMIHAVATIVRAVSCLVSADIEAGYGPRTADVAATVDAVLDAGVVGINLEDNTHGQAQSPLFGIDAQCARISAARDVAERRGLPMVINARTDTFLLGLGANVEERLRMTVDRGSRYLRAGADLVFVPLLVDVTLVKRLADELGGRLSLMALPGAPSAGELFAAGAARVSIGQMAMVSALGSLKRVAEELHRQGTWRSIEETFFGFAEAEALFSQ
jgi:2-methylisocitrate lyase-like PEP mutase family enzyme/pimeloyl-ACP methyl ester carboxylesterase